jgi:mRNA-degrading endonuclease toxin of MazEF toxin-antitoxin module
MVILIPDAVNNLAKPSALDLFQVRCLSEERLVRKIGEITLQELSQVQVALKTVFGIP